MKILVFGGAGFLGKNLIHALIARNADIRVFDRPGSTPERSWTESTVPDWLEGDFINQSQVEEAMQGCDVVFHLISTTLPKTSNENPVYDVESNVVSSIRMMEAARRSGIKKIIFISSGGTVYGVPQSIPILESHSTDPICAYGIGKLSIEKYLQLYYVEGGPDYTILRLANPYGRYQSPESIQGAISVFTMKALKDQEVEIWGDGSVIRDYIYIEDVVDAMLRSIEYSSDQKIFNIGSGKGTSLNQILDTIEEVLGRKVKRVYSEARGFDVPVNILDISRANSHLGWEPSVPLRDGIEKMVRYLESL